MHSLEAQGWAFFESGGLEVLLTREWFRLMFGVGLAALVSIQPVLCWSIYSRDIHVLFWLGQAPTYP